MLAIPVVAQLVVSVLAPDTAAACDAITVRVTANRYNSTTPPALEMPALRQFDVFQHSTFTRVERTTTGAPVGVTQQFVTLTASAPGRYVLPVWTATAGAEIGRSAAHEIVVGPPRRGRPVVLARARIDTSPLPMLRTVAQAETVFVGQQATYEVAVFLNQAARERLRRNPTFYPPEMQAMLAYDLPASSASGSGSTCFDALVYRRALFPLVPGRVVIPPAQLVYSTGLSSSSLFSREESHEIQTDSVSIIAVEPPTADRPPEYVGAVGAMRLESWLDSASARVGDPMLYTVRVTGNGNVKLFPRPQVRVPWAGLVAADERVQVDSGSARIGGSKEFDWVLTPRIAGEFDVPPVRYGYFDPSRRRYDVAQAPSRRIRVGAGMLAGADTGMTETVLRVRTSYRGPVWPPLHTRPEFWLLMALAPMPALASRARRRRDTVAHKPVDPVKALVTSPADDSVTLRRQFVRALAQRLGCSPEDFTHPGALERALRRAGVSEDTAARAETQLRELDAAAYDGSSPLPPNAARNSAAVAGAVDAEALARRELPLWIPVALLAALLGGGIVGVAVAAEADPAASQFARGVSAYFRQDYVVARDAFAETVMLEPASPDAWANYGTAAWAAADTAAAVLGWRQSLALDTGAEDMQQQLRLVRELGPSSPGWVPSVPRNGATVLFAVLWLSAWTFGWIARRPHPWAGRLPLPLAASAFVVGLLAIELQSRVSGARLAVVRRAVSLTSEPALGMDRGPTVGTGELVRVSGRRGTWTRVEASDDRDGWVPSSQLLLLADRRPARD